MASLSQSPIGVTTIKPKEWSRGMRAFLWVEIADGSLKPITSIGADYWIITGGSACRSSWCCHAGTTIYLCPNETVRNHAESVLRTRLKEQRDEWDRQERETWDRIRSENRMVDSVNKAGASC